MNGLDRFMEFVASGVFLCVGFRKIWGYRHRPKPLEASQPRFPFGLPHATIVVVGVLEVTAALALLTPHATLVPLAAAVLALMMIAAGIYHVRRHEPAAPTVVLFLLTIFVIVGRW